MNERLDTGLTLDEQINNQLASKAYIPPKTETFGHQFAALGTNEKIDSSFFRTIKGYNPDGYIVGVGCGMSLGLPLGFKGDKLPKGVILIDIDREVTAMSKAFVKAIQQSNNIVEFYNNFYRDPLNLAPKFLSNDQKALDAIQNMSSSKKSDIEASIERSRGKLNKRISDDGRPSLDNMLGATYDFWKKLVIEGRVAVVEGSLTDTQVIDTITNLPGYQSSKNLIYLSNITDHIVSKKSWEKCETDLSSYLQAISCYIPKEQQAIFIDTLRSFDYRLRVSKGVPIIYPADMVIIHKIPEGFIMPHRHIKQAPKNFTSFNLSDLKNEDLLKILNHSLDSLAKTQPKVERDSLLTFANDIVYSLLVIENSNEKYYGNMKPLDWVRFRFGNEIYQIVVVLLEKKLKIIK